MKFDSGESKHPFEISPSICLELEKQTWETLLREVCRQQSRFTYPDFVLGILVVCFMVIVVWPSIQVLNFREVFRPDSWMNIGLVIVLMNLITSPVSAIAISNEEEEICIALNGHCPLLQHLLLCSQ